MLVTKGGGGRSEGMRPQCTTWLIVRCATGRGTPSTPLVGRVYSRLVLEIKPSAPLGHYPKVLVAMPLQHHTMNMTSELPALLQLYLKSL